MSFTLPSLPYAANALAQAGMCQETLEYHHGKHHQAYVNTLNTLVEGNTALHGKSLVELIQLSFNNAELTAVFNNAGQHWNHSFFWTCLSPKGGKLPSRLEAKIIEDFGSVDQFKSAFKQAATTQFGSGWAWLVLSPEGKLKITKTSNAGTPVSEKADRPLLTFDVWEHAYYLDFRNRRPDYTTNFLDKLANYEFAEAQLLSA